MKSMKEIREELAAIHKEQTGGKKTTQELLEMFKEAEEKAPSGSTWDHYKGGMYIVLGHGFHTETEEMLVQYQRLDGPGYNASAERLIWYSRPLDVWLSENDDGQPRFVKQED
tara:strand:- start:287 stop:625 length:339 start_codon:yes stop_codon:yes gene_type:complete